MREGGLEVREGWKEGEEVRECFVRSQKPWAWHIQDEISLRQKRGETV